jgi:alcohol dehydrogenase class IV
MDYVNPPIGEGRKPPSPLKPHLAIPTTSGTGSRGDHRRGARHPDLKVKTGISHRYLRPARRSSTPS